MCGANSLIYQTTVGFRYLRDYRTIGGVFIRKFARATKKAAIDIVLKYFHGAVCYRPRNRASAARTARRPSITIPKTRLYGCGWWAAYCVGGLEDADGDGGGGCATSFCVGSWHESHPPPRASKRLTRAVI